MTTMTDIQTVLTRALEQAGPSVVGVASRMGRGSGIVIAANRILTNAHNLRGSRIHVFAADGSRVAGQPLGVDVDGDLAIIEAEVGGPGIEWSDIDTGIGSPVVALANPGGAGMRATIGYVSGVQRTFRGPRGRRIPGSFEHTAPLLPGSSGGPVVDPDGKLAGINTNRLGEGFYLAIPADDALRAKIDTLAAGRSVAPPRLGIGVAPAHVATRLRRAVGLPEAEGLLVRQVEGGSAAEAAGLREGDLITAVGGEPVTTVDALHELLARLGPGEHEVRYLRGAEDRTATVTMAV